MRNGGAGVLRPMPPNNFSGVAGVSNMMTFGNDYNLSKNHSDLFEKNASSLRSEIIYLPSEANRRYNFTIK
jgi:hypothetical protein